jgi:thiol-disulfide isomerase/thioredoxin
VGCWVDLDMVRYISLLLFIGLLWGQGADYNVKKIKEGDIAPNWSLRSESGSFEFLKNWTVKNNRKLRKPLIQPDRHVVLFTFFAAWCPPCVEQLQPLEEVFQKYKDEKIKFFIIDETDNTGNAAVTKSLLADNKINIPYLEDNWKVSRRYGIEGIPTIFIVDKYGIIQNIRVGFSKEDQNLAAELSAIIDQLLLEK